MEPTPTSAAADVLAPAPIGPVAARVPRAMPDRRVTRRSRWARVIGDIRARGGAMCRAGKCLAVFLLLAAAVAAGKRPAVAAGAAGPGR